MGGYFLDGGSTQANKEDCCGIPNCGKIKETTTRPCPVQDKWGRLTKSRFLRNECESEEETIQEVEKTVIDTSKLQWKELESGNCPFVIDCADCPAGLEVPEQVTWARNTDHPMMEFPKVAADTHWWKAIAFEVKNNAIEMDD